MADADADPTDPDYWIELLEKGEPDPEDLFPYGDRFADEKALHRSPTMEARQPDHPPPFEGERFPLGGPKL